MNLHLRVLSTTFIGKKRFLGHVDFCHSDGESQQNCRKLSKYYLNFLEDAKQGDLNGTNEFRLFHHVAKCSERETQGIKAIEIPNQGKSSVVRYWRGHDYGAYSQKKYHQVNQETDEVQSVPAITRIKGNVFKSISIKSLFNQ